jgi:hypothetical protein
MRRLRHLAVLVFAVASSTAWAQQEQLEVMFDLAQYSHPGSWSFSLGCTHNPPTGRTNYVHITVVWLEDMNGNYLTTLHRWGRSYAFDLKAWAAVAGEGIDGVTSATPTSNGNMPAQVFTGFTTGPQNISWLPDGTYRVRLESTQCELADGWRTPPNPNPFAGGSAFGPTATFTFTKGRASQMNAAIGSMAPFNNVRVNYTVPATPAPPAVYAGVDQWRRPSVTPSEATTMLTGVVAQTNPPSVQWTVRATKPAGLMPMIASPTSPTTAVTFTQAGIYTFRLTATDSGGRTNFDEVIVYVNARVIDSAGDAEVASGNATVAMGIIENSGPWTWAHNQSPNPRARAYFRFDLTGTSGRYAWATLQLRPAESTPDPMMQHDFYILTDAQDDWNGPANTSTDYEATVTWNNQSVVMGNQGSLAANQLVGTWTHTACQFRHAFVNPATNPGQPASVCPARLDIDLNLTNVMANDTNRIWSLFMAPRQSGANGLGVASDENAVSTKLLVVESWQSGTNQPPVAVPGTYPTVADRTPPLGAEPVTLNASGSTDDGTIATYEWRENGMLLGSTNMPTFNTTLPLGVHTLELTVIDNGGLSARATTTVTVEDRFEPNHARAMAATVTGSAAGTTWGNLFASAAAPNGDWYGIDLVAGSTLTVATTAAGNLDLRVYDPQGMMLGSSATMAATETVMVTAAAAGRHFIQVEAVGGVAGASTYSMTVTASGALTVTLNPASAVESAGTLTGAGRVTLDAPAPAAVMVSLTSSQPMQLSFPAATVTIPMGMTSATFDVTLVNDPPGVPNTSRFVTIGAAATGFNPGSAQFEILDDEAALFVSWDKAAETVPEAASPTVQLKATLSGPATSPVVIPFTVSGTASRGSDYNTPITAGQLTISSGTSATWLINVVNDTDVDPDETVVVTMGTPTGASASGQTVFTLTITDDDSGGADGGNGPGGTTGACGCSQGGLTAALVPLLLLGLARLRRRR